MHTKGHEDNQNNICFAIMPFGDEFGPIYDRIVAAAQHCGYLTRRGDSYKTTDFIMKTIVQDICRCDLIVADLTGGNSNVFLELGIALSIANKTVMISQEKPPFDLSFIRVLLYSPEKLDRLEIELSERIKEWQKEAYKESPVQELSPEDSKIHSIQDYKANEKELQILKYKTGEISPVDILFNKALDKEYRQDALISLNPSQCIYTLEHIEELEEDLQIQFLHTLVGKVPLDKVETPLITQLASIVSGKQEPNAQFGTAYAIIDTLIKLGSSPQKKRDVWEAAQRWACKNNFRGLERILNDFLWPRSL